MAKDNKLLWVAGISALLIGGGLFFYFRSKKQNEITDEGNVEPTDTTKSGGTSTTHTKSTKPKTGASTTPTHTTTPTNSYKGFTNGGLVYLKMDKSSIYSYPEFKGDYIIGSISKDKMLDKPFAKYISNTGKGFLKVETIAYEPTPLPNQRIASGLQVKKTIAYVPESFVSPKPY
jgi:hypothetical protein